jgi:aspartyl-tRNA(Asn)/glutamyl-tRNA(Gln) amidotransferase subunit A
LTGVRLGRAEPYFWEDTSPGVSERVDDALSFAAADGARVADATLPALMELFELYHKGGIVSAELYAFLSAELPDWLETLDPRVRRRIDVGKELPAWDYLQRKARYVTLAADAATSLAEIDALISPTVPITPPPVAEIIDHEAYVRTNLLALRNTCPASFLGLCAVTIPAGRDAAGMPVGLQLVGAPGSEVRLLGIAMRLERVLAKKGIWHHPGA